MLVVFLHWEDHLVARAGTRSSTPRICATRCCAAGSRRSCSSTCCRRACSSSSRCSCRSRSVCPPSPPACGSCPCRSPCCSPPSACHGSSRTRSPRLVVRVGFLALFAGIVVMVAAARRRRRARDRDLADAARRLGIGALASQLGAVTVSSVPDEQSGEVGGLQNTVTNLGASIGTALAGAVLISALTSSFFSQHRRQPRRPRSVTGHRRGRADERCPVHVGRRPRGGARGGRRPARHVADAIVDENAPARLDALRAVAVGPRAHHRGGDRRRPAPAGAISP